MARKETTSVLEMSGERKMGKYRKACGGGTAEVRDLNLHDLDIQSQWKVIPQRAGGWRGSKERGSVSNRRGSLMGEEEKVKGSESTISS